MCLFYVFLENSADWPGSVVNVVASSGEKFTIKGVQGKPPFCKVTVPMMAEVTAEANRDGNQIGTASSKAYAPALFLEISKKPGRRGDRQRRSRQQAQRGEGARIDIELQSHVRSRGGARLLP